MTKKELIEKIIANDGSYIKNGINFTYDDDGLVRAIGRIGGVDFNAFIIKPVDTCDFYISTNVEMSKVNAYVDFVRTIANIVGMDIKISEDHRNITRSETNGRIDMGEAELQKKSGMVEAYEKLLLGRNITISA